MTFHPATVLFGLAVVTPVAAAAAETSHAAPAQRSLMAQVPDATGLPAPPPSPPDAGPSGSAPESGSTPAPLPRAPAPAANSATATPNLQRPSAATVVPTTAGSTRNGAAALPTMAQPGATQGSGTSSITFGGPQTDLQPTYGSSLRDSGAGTDGVPVYSNAPTTLGGPINGTANAYTATLPYGAPLPGQTTSTKRGSEDGATFYTQKPLGGVPNTRDQTGTFGGRGGYNAQGIYNGTAAQPGNGYGYGSPYAPSGRPMGGLLSTNVDATGPLRPYVPLNTSPTGRPNSGYGVPNGSRSTHMDGRGIQRVD